MTNKKIYEALIVISGAFLVIYLFGMLKNGESSLLYIYISLGILFTGIFIMPLGKLIAAGWYKLADLLSFVMSKLILGVVYIFILVPVALLYKLINKDKLQLKRSSHTKWIDRNHQYSAKDLKNIW